MISSRGKRDVVCDKEDEWFRTACSTIRYGHPPRRGPGLPSQKGRKTLAFGTPLELDVRRCARKRSLCTTLSTFYEDDAVAGHISFFAAESITPTGS